MLSALGMSGRCDGLKRTYSAELGDVTQGTPGTLVF